MEEKNPSYVEGILNTLAELERKSETLISEVEVMKKRLISIANDEIESIKRHVIDRANNEAQVIIDTSKQEAENESLQISKESDNELSLISKNIDSSFDKAVEMVVQKIRSDFVSSNNNNSGQPEFNAVTTKAENLQNAPPVAGTTKRSKKDNLSS